MSKYVWLYWAVTLLSSLVIALHAFASFSHFYMAARFLTTNKICIAILCNLFIGIGITLIRLTLRIFVGELASDELEHVKHSMKLYVSDILLAVATSHRSFPASASFHGALIMALRFIHLSLDVKTDNLVRMTGMTGPNSENSPKWRFIRLVSFCILLFWCDLYFARKQLVTAFELGFMNSTEEFFPFLSIFNSIFGFLGFSIDTGAPIIPASTHRQWYISILIFGEYILLAFSALRSFGTFCINYYDISSNFDFPKKPFVSFFVDMFIDGSKLTFVGVSTIYIGAHANLPLHYVRDCIVTLSTCHSRALKFVNYLLILKQVSKNFTDVPRHVIEAEEIICIVCRDTLKVNESCKETRCGHKFHFQCLKDWLERNAKCPLCQAPLIGRSKSRTRENAQNPNAAAQNRPVSSRPQPQSSVAPQPPPSPISVAAAPSSSSSFATLSRGLFNSMPKPAEADEKTNKLPFSFAANAREVVKLNSTLQEINPNILKTILQFQGTLLSDEARFDLMVLSNLVISMGSESGSGSAMFSEPHNLSPEEAHTLSSIKATFEDKKSKLQNHLLNNLGLFSNPHYSQTEYFGFTMQDPKERLAFNFIKRLRRQYLVKLTQEATFANSLSPAPLGPEDLQAKISTSLQNVLEPRVNILSAAFLTSDYYNKTETLLRPVIRVFFPIATPTEVDQFFVKYDTESRV